MLPEVSVDALTHAGSDWANCVSVVSTGSTKMETSMNSSTPESLLELDFSQPLFILIDRIVVSPEARARIVDAAETGYRESGEVIFEVVPRADGK